MFLTETELKEDFWILEPEKYFIEKSYKYVKIGDIYYISTKLKFKDRCHIEDTLKLDYGMRGANDFDEVISIINDVYYSDTEISVTDMLDEKGRVEFMIAEGILTLDKCRYIITVNNTFLKEVIDI